MTLIIDSFFFNQPLSIRLFIIVLTMGLIGGGAYYFKQLTVSGTIAAVLVGGISMYIYGCTALLTFLFFFLSAAVISRLSKKIRKIESIQAKGSRRDAMQVIANGGPAMIALLLFKATGKSVFLMVFAACIAEACSDTWAGDIGVLSKSEPVSILTGRKIPKGLSGGISFLGTFSGLLGAILVSCIYFSSFEGTSLALAAIAAASAFLGCLSDSFLGATIQAHYYDEERDMLTEHTVSKSGKKLELVRGIRFMDNDMVNLTSNIVTFVFAFAMSFLVI